jgi:secreted trypsin-like serine protease
MRFIVTGLLIAVAASSAPIVTRHDIPDQAYLELAEELPITSAIIRYSSTDVAGTLISDRWILSAAHVAETIRPGRKLLTLAGDSVEVERVGISSGQSTSETDGEEGLYGVTEYYSRVSTYREWIRATMAG